MKEKDKGMGGRGEGGEEGKASGKAVIELGKKTFTLPRGEACLALRPPLAFLFSLPRNQSHPELSQFLSI